MRGSSGIRAQMGASRLLVSLRSIAGVDKSTRRRRSPPIIRATAIMNGTIAQLAIELALRRCMRRSAWFRSLSALS
jgi:hypothetical protein